MYTVYAGTRLLYHPKLVEDGFVIYNPVVTLEANKSGSFQFTMPVTNSAYNFLEKMKTVITVYNDGEEIFRGRILNDERDFYNNKVIYCEGEMAFLLDSVIRPYTPSEPQTIREFLVDILDMHNAQVDEFKRFTMGQCDIGVDMGQEFRWPVEDYTSAWGVIQGLLDYFGGYIRTRLENGVRYFDYISSYNHTNTQVVAFGENLLDISHYISAENVITTLIPLGVDQTVEMTNSEIQQVTPDDPNGWKKAYVVSEPFSCLDKSASPAYIFTLEIWLDSQYAAQDEEEVSHVTVSGKIRTVSGERSWSGLDGNQIQANLKMRIRNTSRYIDERNQIVAQLKLGSTNVSALRNGKITTTDQEILRFSGDVDRGNLGVTLEFVNRYTRSTNGAKKAPISCAVGANANLYAQKNVRLTIKDADESGGLDYITNTATEQLFGKIVGTQTWDYIDDPNELYDVAVDYLTNNVRMNVKLEINAMDLNLLNVAYEKFKIGDAIRVVSAPHRLDEEFICTKISLDLQNPENNMYSLGHEFTTLTETRITAAKDIQVTNEMIAQINNSLDAAETVVEQMNQLVNTIYDKYADITTVINNLDAAYAEIDFANITNAAIANLVANQALITSLDAAYIRADVANLTDATINNLIAGKIEAGQVVVDGLGAKLAVIDFANIVDAAITNLLAKQIIVDNITVGVADINMANITTAGINRLKTNFADINFANITQAAINNLTANTTFTNYLQGNYADINFANITTAALQNALVNTGLFNSLVVQDDVVVGGTLSADSITVGTLKAERLAIRGLDGIYYQLNLAKKNDGDITQEEWAAIDPDDLKDAFHGENIIANTITAKQIAAGTITAQKLAVLDATNVTYQYPSGGSTATKTMSGFISDVNGLTSTVSSVQTTVNSSVKSYTYRYFKSTSPTTQPSDADFDGASGSDTMPAREEGKYIWRRTTQTKNDNTTTKVYEMIQGVDGDPGTPGAPGTSVTITSKSVQYRKSSSGTTAPTSGWGNNVVSTVAGEYLWTKVVVNYSDGNSTTAYSVSYHGDTGPTGPTGPQGTSVTVSSVGYQAGSSNTTAPTGSWSSNPVSVPEGQYLWTKVTYSDNSVIYSVARQGVNGSPGSPGTSVTVRSVQYQQGSSATTAPTGAWSNSPPAVEEGKYLWTKIEFSDNTVSYMVAKQGATGPQGVSVSKVEPLYYLKSESTPTPGTAPTAPNSVVTSTATTAGAWTLSVPEYIEPDTENNVYYFYWTCQQTTYDTSPATYTWSAVTPDSELNDIRVEMTRSNTLIEQNSENIRLQASTTEELFGQAYDAATGAASAVEDERKARVAAINVVSGSVTTLASNTVAKSTYNADKETWETAIEELQSSSLTVESGAITAMVADISSLQKTQDSLATAFQVRDNGTYVFQSQVLNKTVTTIFYQKNSNSEAPTAPTNEVTSTSTSYNTWTKAIPTERTGYYYWTCDQTKYLDGPKAGTLECTTVTLLEETPTETVTKTVAYPAIIESGYTKTTAEGQEVWVQGNEVAWNTASGSGTKEFSIGDSASDTARWQFRRAGDLLNISWHS